ncbi:hypothetical protein AmDm5_1190 [Acetobacter malorum]|nr:hypothetical protein AmDm5_1190 [Acetobacter malorum]
MFSEYFSDISRNFLTVLFFTILYCLSFIWLGIAQAQLSID